MISATDLRLTFGRGTPLENPALRGMSLTVNQGEFVTVNLTPDVSIEEALSLCMTVLELEDGRRNGIPVTRARLDTVWANHKGMARAYIEHVTESVE